MKGRIQLHNKVLFKGTTFGPRSNNKTVSARIKPIPSNTSEGLLSRQFGSPKQEDVENETTDVEAGSDLHSTGRKTIHFVILTTTNGFCKEPTSPHKTHSLPSAAVTASAVEYLGA